MQSDTKKRKSKTQSAASESSPRAEDYPVVIAWDDEDKIFIADVPALQGCTTHGRTREEAATNAKEAAELWLEVAARDGSVIPAPIRNLSGKFVVRVPKSLHESLAKRAEIEGVSLNQWVVTALARADGRARV